MDYVTIILSAAKAAKVSGTVLLAICMNESGLNNVTVQHDGGSPSIGICQVKYETAKMLGYEGKASGLTKPEENAKWAAEYLRFQNERYDGDMCKAVAAYNAGRYNESKIVPGCPRNLKYVKKVQAKLSREEQRHLSCRIAKR